MLRSRSARLVLTFLSVVATAALSRGLAYADAEPGTAESNYSNTVEVDGTGDSQVNVSSQSSSTTSVGSSSDGTETTPSVTEEQNSQTTVNNSSISTDTSTGTTTPTGQNDQSSSGTVTGQASTGGSNSNIGASGNNVKTQVQESAEVGRQVALADASGNESPAPVAPAPEKSTPAPATSSNGAVNSTALGSGTGSTGKGFIASIFQFGWQPPARGQLIILALLLIVLSSFMSFLRRSGFAHAPRSDDPVAGSRSLSFATPRVEIQAVPSRAVPVFIVASETKQLIDLGRR